MRRKAVWSVSSIPLALGLMLLPAHAQDGSTTVVAKTPAATGSINPQAVPDQGQAPQRAPIQTGSDATQPKDQLRPAQDLDDSNPPEPPADAAQPGEINQNAADEGAGWQAAVEAAPGPTPLIGAQQDEAVKRIDAYFNGITNLQGNFDQVDSNNKHTTGRFYVQRPGKLRFDYAPPSSLKIVADGSFLAIEDSDLKTVEKYPLDSTPFRLLLTDGVDLGRDAHIIGVESGDGQLAITLEDKTGQAAGQIKLYFDNGAELKLKRWVITDAQGFATQVTINDVVPGRRVAADFFNSTDNFQPFR